MSFKRNIINRRVIKDLKKRSSIGIVFYVVGSFIIIFTDNYYNRHPGFSMAFLISINGICLFRVIHLAVSSWSSEKYEKLNNKIFMASVGLTALIWGLMFAKLLGQKGEHDIKLIMAICIIALGGGGVIAFMPYFRLSVIFNFLIFMPGGVFMFYQNDNPQLAVTIILFSLYMFLISYRGNNEYWEALENEFLVKEKSEELKKLSRTDVLTGLYNRRYFDEVFDYEWTRAVRNKTLINIMICDIDHFKKVNDTYGHLAGDEYLKMASGILSRVLKRKTDIVARYGGEEFVVLIPEINPDRAYELAEKVRLEIQANYVEYNNANIKTTMSIGISSLIPGFDNNKDQLVFCADSALYKAKNQGRNRVETGCI